MAKEQRRPGAPNQEGFDAIIDHDGDFVSGAKRNPPQVQKTGHARPAPKGIGS